MARIRRNDPGLATALVSLSAIAVMLALRPWLDALAHALGIPGWSVALGAVLTALAVVYGTSELLSARGRRAFDEVPACDVAALAPGGRARVRVTLTGPAALLAPVRGTRCCYYEAQALIDPSDPDGGDAGVVGTRSDGELAIARDASGEIELDLRDGVSAMEGRLTVVTYEQPREHDPLGVGVGAPYRVRLSLLHPGDELEVIGSVESGADTRCRVVPEGGALRIRVLGRRPS